MSRTEYVVVRLSSAPGGGAGSYILGKVMGENDRIIDIEDALTINHRVNPVTMMPEIWFSKYCLYNQCFEVGFKKENLSHIFRDPLEAIIIYYERQLKKIKSTYDTNNKEIVFDDKDGESKILIKKKKNKIDDEYEEIDDITEMILRELNDDTIH
jgi:hypothetical protein